MDKCIDIAYSRPLRAAQALGNLASDHLSLFSKAVLLTGEKSVLSTQNGMAVLRDSLMLLIRFCARISVHIPKEFPELETLCCSIVKNMRFAGDIEFLSEDPRWDQYDSVLNVGASRVGKNVTIINNDGWLIRVSSGAHQLPCGVANYNPISALAAASLGASETFKRLLSVKTSRGPYFDGLSFSLYSYTAVTDDDGPPLPALIDLNLSIAGGGAIGSSVFHLLSQLPVTGFASIVDAQCYRRENLGTSIIIGPEQLEVPKARFGEILLSSSIFQVKGFHEKIDEFANRLGQELPYPSVILGCLDNVSARYEIQRLWPDLIIDGAIGDFACQVSRHPIDGDIACLQCLFREIHREPAEVAQARATGLRLERVMNMFSEVSEEDVRIARPEKQAWLAERIGHQVCAVIREGIAREISEQEQDQRFQPSVPFVACFSASMMVTELVRASLNGASPLAPRYQLDILFGPLFGLDSPQGRRHDCTCVTHRANILRMRQSLNNQ